MKNDITTADTGISLRMSICLPADLLDDQDREVPAVERRQRHQVHETDEHRHERQEVQDGAPVPGRSGLTHRLSDADHARRILGPRFASVNNSVNTRPIPDGPNTRVI